MLDNELISVPQIDWHQYPDGLGGGHGSRISGGFTIDSAQQLANLLKTGALPIKLELISASQVSATLGKQALNQGLVAGAVGFIIVALFLLIFYRVLGVIAVGALVVYAVFFYALIKLVPITMTLPGIAGLILTIGVAADANIVIFERVKEELRGGRSIPAAIATGYKRGLSAIVDANVVTFMVAFILFLLATAGVKGFAFTLGVGTLVSFFTAVLLTQAVLGAMGRSRLIHSPAALGVAKHRERRRFDYMGASKWFFSMSGVILLIGALAIGGKGLNFGIDFESGTRVKTELNRSTNENDVRNAIAPSGFADAEVQRISGPGAGKNAFQISTTTLNQGQRDKIQKDLQQKFGVKSFDYDTIGPTFGQTVAKSAVIAIIASLLVISLYIALRFEWKYAVPVLIALMHDLLITAGVYSLLGREVTTSTVAALLTILGYSLYDTIIVFDRVRENVPRMPRAAFSQIVNRSMSEVLTRSLATSFCTALPIAALLFFGGDTLKDFAFALLVGVISGTYSSIFIASPVLTHWKERETVYVRRRRRIAEDNDGVVPPYAVGASGALVDVAPAEKPPGAAHHAARGSGAAASRRPSSTRWCATCTSRRRPRPPPSATPPPTSTPRTSCSRTTSPRRPSPSGRATAATGGAASHGHARLDHDGPRHLALHDLPARSLLGRHRRRLPRRAHRRGHLRLHRQRLHGSRPGRHARPPGPRGDPGHADRDRHRLLRGHPPRQRGARALVAALSDGARGEHRGREPDAHRGDQGDDDLGALPHPVGRASR